MLDNMVARYVKGTKGVIGWGSWIKLNIRTNSEKEGVHCEARGF